MNWAFVGYENIGSLEAVNIADFERVFVFCGPKNTKIKVGTVPSDGFCRIELIGVRTTGSNNLDFHLAFHLGRYHEIAEKGVIFHIVSNDSGFNGLVNHLNKIGRNCKKVATKDAKRQQNASVSLSAQACRVVSRLKPIDGRKRPREKEKLRKATKLDQGTMPGIDERGIARSCLYGAGWRRRSARIRVGHIF